MEGSYGGSHRSAEARKLPHVNCWGYLSSRKNKNKLGAEHSWVRNRFESSIQPFNSNIQKCPRHKTPSPTNATHSPPLSVCPSHSSSHPLSPSNKSSRSLRGHGNPIPPPPSSPHAPALSPHNPARSRYPVSRCLIASRGGR